MLRLLFLSLITTFILHALLAPLPCPYDQELQETITGELLGTNRRTLSQDLKDFWANHIHLPTRRTLAHYRHWAERLPDSCTKEAYFRAITTYEKD